MTSQHHQDLWKRALKTQEVIRDPRTGARYGIKRLIGRGGYSEVYEVVEVTSGRSYALKCLRLKHADDPRSVERARREGSALWRLNHPNVVRCHGLGVREDGLVWMVMDLLEGRTLRELATTIGRVPIPWALQVAIAICDGLRAVHEVCVHRDLKPENVHVSDDGEKICLLDLGVGKFPHDVLLTTGEMTLGTVSYMSPEQLETPTTIDGRSDLFAIGIMLYELMSGIHPFCPEGLGTIDRMAIGLRIIATSHVPLQEAAPWMPAYVAQVIELALIKDRNKRYPSPEAMSRALRATLDRYTHERGPSAPLGLVGALPREPSIYDTEPQEIAAGLELPASPNPYVASHPSTTVESATTATESSDPRPPPKFAVAEFRRFDRNELKMGAARATPPSKTPLPTLGGATTEPRQLASPALAGARLEALEATPNVAGARNIVHVPAAAATEITSGVEIDAQRRGRLLRPLIVIVTALVVVFAGIRILAWAQARAPLPEPGDRRPSSSQQEQEK